MKVRHLCAVVGIAIAVGAVTFMRSLVATGDHQSQALAERLLEQVPVGDSAKIARFSLDVRPNGRVLQGPPMMAFAVTTDDAVVADEGTCIITRALFAQRRLSPPAIGETLVLIGRRGAYALKVVGIREWERPVRGYPNLFVGAATAASIDENWRPFEPRSAEDLAPAFQSEDGRNMSRARPLLLWAAALTALCLLMNALFLSIEARRKEIAILRMVGLTRFGVVRAVAFESVELAAVGWTVGTVGALVALGAYVCCQVAAFPMGMAIAWEGVGLCAALTPVVAAVAALVALRPALSVRPLEAASDRTPRKRSFGMLISFACGFGAFVAVEVWGASLMSAFVPSPEWPDAIVSILPTGVSAFDISKVKGRLEGVKRIHELQPLQVNLLPREELTGFKSQRPGGGKAYRNALLLASDYLPPFKFVAGDRNHAFEELVGGDACLITEMMARARNLRLNDELPLDLGEGEAMNLKIVGILDLNWHMVTSRALVRGMNRMPSNTDGPVFVGFDTLAACDVRPQQFVKMTHLWLDYEEGFLRAHGPLEASRIVEREIAETFGTEGNAVRTHARDEIADGTLSHGNDIIGAMARVPFIFIVVISLGFVAMLVAAADSRKREFAVLRAVGATRAQLAVLLAKEALGVALRGVVIGFFGGALTGWLFTHGTRAAMANWGIPPNFAMPWLVVGEGAVGAIAFALLVAVPAAFLIVGKSARDLPPV